MSRPITSFVCREPEELSLLLARLEAGDALGEGRVFVDGERAAHSRALEAGARVEIYAARPAVAPLRVLALRDGLAFVEKPPGLATEPERRGSYSLVTQFAAEQGLAENRVHALSRLDVGVSGVVLLGLDAAARQRVMTLRESGRVQRRYVALAERAPEPASGRWNDAIQRGKSGNRRSTGAGERAETLYRSFGATAGCALAFEPITGRTHQLRVHASAHGSPLLGDRAYGGSNRLRLSNGEVRSLDRIFLHAAWVRLGDEARVESALPPIFDDVWRALGGERSALTDAVEQPLSESTP